MVHKREKCTQIRPYISRAVNVELSYVILYESTDNTKDIV